jgi:hypothetical protein
MVFVRLWFENLFNFNVLFVRSETRSPNPGLARLHPALNRCKAILASALILLGGATWAQTTYFTRQTGDWNQTTTWSTVAFGDPTNTGTFPVAGDIVNVGGGVTVTVTAPAACASLSFTSTAGNHSVVISSANALAVSGAITIPRNGNSNTLNVGAGTLTAGSLSFTTGTGSGVQQVTVSTGTVTVSGNITGFSGAGTLISYSGNGLVQVGGTMFASGSGAIATVAGSRFEYNGSAQTVQALAYRDLILSGSGTKTFTTATTTLGGDLTVSGVTTNVPGLTLTVSGTTTVNSGGTLAFVTSAAGTKLFVGLVTINAGGTWNNAVNEGFTFRGGITNNGTGNWTGGGTGTYAFNTTPTQTITGAINAPTITVSGGTTNLINNGTITANTVTVTGVAVDLTNNGILTANVALGGTGELVQGAGATLNLGGTSLITTFTATAAGNTVNYSGAAQTVRAVNYANLGLSGSGAKTLQSGTTSISGNFTVSGTASASAVVGLTIGGDFTLGSGTAFTTGSFTHQIAGNFTNNGGTFTSTGSTIVLNGAAQTVGGSTTPANFNDLTLAGSGAKALNVVVAVAGTLSINTGVQANLGSITTHTANALRLGGGPVPAGTWGSTSSAAANQNDVFFVAGATGFITVATGAFTYFSRATGAWNAPATWSTVGFGGPVATTAPGASDEVFVGGGFTVTVTAAAAAAALTFQDTGSTLNGLDINSGQTLAVSGAVTIPRNGNSNTLNVGAGTVTAGSLSFTAGAGSGVQQITVSTGTVTVSGNISGFSGAGTLVSYSGNGLVQVGGAMFASGSGAIATVAGSRFEYNGGAQTVQALAYRDLTLSGSGTKTFTTTTTTLGGSLTVTGVTANVPGLTLTVNGATTVNSGGTLAFVTSTAGTKLFVGLVTINSGGTWNNAVNEGFTFQGGITNNGTWNGGTAGTYLFNTNTQTIAGAITAPTVTVTGAAIDLINNGTFTANVALGGTGELVQGAGATLNLGGTSLITTFTATAAGNTVNYTGAAQTVRAVNYANLGLSGNGAKTLGAGTTSISGNFSISGTASASAVVGLTIGGDFTLGSGTAFTTGSFTHQIAGNFTNNGGTFTSTGSTIVLNGAAQTVGGSTTPANFNDLTLAGSGAKALNVVVAVAGTLSINTGVQANLGSITTHTANALRLGGGPVPAGTWGSTSSAAANQNDVFFVPGATGFITVATGAFTYFSRATGAWNDPATWSTVGFGGPVAATAPGASDEVFVGGGFTVTVTAAASATAVTFQDTGSTLNGLDINSGQTLAISGAVTIPRNGNSNTLNVGAGTLTAGSLSFTAGAGSGVQQVTVSTGTVTVSGNISGFSGAGTLISYSGNGLVQVGGTMFASGSGAIATVAGSRFEYNGGAQTVQALAYRDLILSGSGTKTFTTTTTTLGGSLTVTGVTANVPGLTLTVNGATTVNSGGTLAFVTSTAGTKLFVGSVTINSGGTWNNLINEGFTFRGGITNNGTWNGGTAGLNIFDINSQSLTGTFTFPNVRVTGATVVLTNNNTLTVNTTLDGTGRLTQAPGATLNLAGTSAITVMTATALNNTVNYTGTTTQTINNNNFFNIGLSGGGAKNFQAGTTSIAGNLVLSGSVSATAAAGITIGGNVSIGSGTTFTAGAFTHQVAGDWTNDGTFVNVNSTIVLNGAAQTLGGSVTPLTFHHLTVSGTGDKIFANRVEVSGNLAINSPATANLAAPTHLTSILLLDAAAQTPGIWGSAASGAPNISPRFTGTGQLTVGSIVFFSAVASGDWSNATSWSNSGHTGPPAAAPPTMDDVVVIGNGNVISVTSAVTCADLIFDQNLGGANAVNITGANSLTVTGTVTLPRSAVAGSNQLNVAAGSLNAGTISFTNGSGTGAHQLSISTGTAVVSNGIASAGPGASASVQITGAGILRVGGSMFAPALGTLTTAAGSQFNYNGAAQTVSGFTTYHHLALSGSGTKTLGGNAVVNGDVSVADGVTFALSVPTVTIDVLGATTVGTGTGGALSITGTGAKLFRGPVTVNAGATWTNTVIPVTFRGGITNLGTFTAGTGVQTFNTTAAQTLTGTFTIPNITVASPTNLTNTNSLTVGTALSGTGQITQGVNATLTINGASAIASSSFTASGNTVTYGGSSQTVRTGNYFNLTLAGSGTKTLQTGTTGISGNFIISGTATTTAVVGLTIGGSVTIGAGTSFTAGSFTHNVAGNWTNNGSFINTGSTINFNGTGAQAISPAQTFNGLTISNNSVAGVTSSAGQTVNGTFTNNGRLTVPNLFLNGDVSLGAGSVTSVPQFDITGAGAQSFSANGNTIDNTIAVNKSGGALTLTSALNLSGIFSLQSATVVNSGGHLRVLSLADDPLQDGSIGPILGGGSITGDVTVERFMGAQGMVNRYIASPVVGATVGQLSDDFAISPNAIRYYHEPRLGPFNLNLDYITVDGTHVMENGRGYLAYMWNGTADITWDVSGTVPVGPVNLPVTHTPSSPPELFDDGWNLVGNPYPCRIVWDDGPGWTRSSSIAPVISVPDIGGPVTERTWNFIDATGDLPNGVIATGQAFWVYADDSATPVLQVNENAKTTTVSGSFFRQREMERSEQLIVRLISEQGREDRAFLKLNRRATDDWDAGLDALKRPHAQHATVALADKRGRSLVMHTLPASISEFTVPLVIDAAPAGSYTLNIDRSGFLSFGGGLWLADAERGEVVEMNEWFNGYAFDVQRAGRIEDRFFITSHNEVAKGLARGFVVHPNPATDQIFVKFPGEVRMIEVLDIGGRVVKTAALRTGQPLVVSDLATGVYLIRVRTAEGTATQRFIKQ